MKNGKDILAIVLGGLGGNQTDDIAEALRNETRVCVPQVPAWSAYKTDIAGILTENPGYENVVMVGHSFAAIPMLQAIALTQCKYLALIDPVSSHAFVGAWPMPQPVPKFDWFRRNPVGITLGFIEVPLDISNAGAPQLIGPEANLIGRYEDLHNELPHQPFVVNKIVQQVLSLPRPV